MFYRKTNYLTGFLNYYGQISSQNGLITGSNTETNYTSFFKVSGCKQFILATFKKKKKKKKMLKVSQLNLFI